MSYQIHRSVARGVVVIGPLESRLRKLRLLTSSRLVFRNTLGMPTKD